MIIHQPEMTIKDGYAILWARIEMATARNNFPEHIWYRVPEEYASSLSLHSDAFLVSALLGGMYFGEDIHVRGTVSPKLAYNLKEYQFILNYRMPKVVKPVSVQYEHLAPIDSNQIGVGSTFSGGVDSLFTIWKHLPQNQADPNFQVTHGVFIRGFDILHSEIDDYHQLIVPFQQHSSKMGIDIIEMDTNMYSVIHQRMNGSYLYGPLIISTGLALSNLFQRFYIPSSWDHYTFQHTLHGSDPLLDGLLSTDSMDIVHHGSMSRRVEKVEQIANWDMAQKILWVCLDAKFEQQTWNCSRCDKCVRTMIPLYALDVLNKFQKFEKPILKDWELLWYARKFNLRSNYFSEMFSFLRKKKPNLVPWLVLATIFGYLRYGLIKYLPEFIKKWLQQFGYFSPRDEADDAYENSEVSKIIMEHDKV